MPDNRTIYTTDDGTNGVMIKFVTDKPADLGSGSLYAAKFIMKGDSKEEFNIEWILLGTGTRILEPLSFSELELWGYTGFNKVHL